MTDTPAGGTLPKVETVQDRKRGSRKAAPPPEPVREAQRYMVVRGERFAFPVEFTGRELLYVQEVTGLRAGEIDEAATAGDVTVLCALTAVAMRREGRDVEVGELLDLPFGNGDNGIDFLEDDGRPPAQGAAEATGTPPSAAIGAPS